MRRLRLECSRDVGCDRRPAACTRGLPRRCSLLLLLLPRVPRLSTSPRYNVHRDGVPANQQPSCPGPPSPPSGCGGECPPRPAPPSLLKNWKHESWDPVYLLAQIPVPRGLRKCNVPGPVPLSTLPLSPLLDSIPFKGLKHRIRQKYSQACILAERKTPTFKMA